MTKKCHDHRLQTNPRHREDEIQNTDGPFADPESLSEGPTFENVFLLLFFFVSLIRGERTNIPLKVGHYRPASETPFKRRGWRADDGPTLNAGLVAL